MKLNKALTLRIGLMIIFIGIVVAGAILFNDSRTALNIIKERNPNLDCKIVGFGYYISGSDHDMVFNNWGYSYECGDKTTGWKDKQTFFLYNRNPGPIIDPTLTRQEITDSISAVSKIVPIKTISYLQKEYTYESFDAHLPSENYVSIPPSYLSLPLIAVSAMDNGDQDTYRVYLVTYSNSIAKVVASYNPYSSDQIRQEN